LPDATGLELIAQRVRDGVSPEAVTSSSPATAVARLPLASPEPWVAVATAPATEMWGSEARLARATPSPARASASSP